MSLGESVASGPFFKTYVANLLPGQFMQPFIDAAFSDLGLDPNVLLPSELHRPAGRPAGHAGAAGALPADRPGRRTASDHSRRHHRQPRRPGCGPPGLPLPGPPAAIPTASRCPRRRLAGRRRDRRPRRRPDAVHAGADAAVRYWCPLPVRRPTSHPGRPDNDAQRADPAGRRAGRDTGRPASVVLLRTTDSDQPHTRRRVLRQQQRDLSPATTFASSACQSAGSTPSSRSPRRSRSRSGTTASTRFRPTPTPRSCRRRW